MNVTVLVVGDIGRSPRTTYQSLSLAGITELDGAVHVDLVGYGGSNPRQEVSDDENITVHHLMPFPDVFPRFLMPLYAPFKVLWLLVQLFWLLLFAVRPPKAILVQNPPAIPALFVVWVVCRLRGAKFVIDWHNFGYTILEVGLGKGHFMVGLYEWYESVFGACGDFHFCVSNAMKATLKRKWGISAVVLYDRAPSFFKPLSAVEKHALFVSVQDEFTGPAADLGVSLSDTTTLFTQTSAFLSSCADVSSSEDGDAVCAVDEVQTANAPSRPALIVSSTSWTPDEDFGILLEAIDICEEKVARLRSGSSGSFPQLIFVITGKGEQKEHYEREIARRLPRYKHTHILTMWLSAANYPKLLGAADLGISLHTSSSGIDLPMKVVDMFGAGLPVCAIDFPWYWPPLSPVPFAVPKSLIGAHTGPFSLEELVVDGVNGLVFSDAPQLATQLYDLFADFPSSSRLAELSAHAQSTTSWHDNWMENAWPVFKACM